MSYEHDKRNSYHLTISQIMETVRFRLAGKVISIVQLIGFALIIALLAFFMFATQPERSAYRAVLIVTMIPPVCCAIGLLISTSKVSNRPISTRLWLVYFYLAWTTFDVVLTLAKTAYYWFRYHDKNQEKSDYVINLVIASVDIFFFVIVWRFMMSLRKARKSQANIEMTISQP